MNPTNDESSVMNLTKFLKQAAVITIMICSVITGVVGSIKYGLWLWSWL